MRPERWRPTWFVGVSAGLHLLAAVVLVSHPAWWPWLLLALAADHAAVLALVLWPRSQALGPALVRLRTGRPEVALTFDDGPDPEVTPQVLALLAAAGATASFFCIGSRARQHPDLVRAIIGAGHSVENHTMTHPSAFACLGLAALRREVGGAQAALTAITEQEPRFFRAPCGFRSPLLDPCLARAGLRAAAWTRRGFDTTQRRPDAVLRRLLRGLAAGDVLLLHDGNGARTADGDPVVLAVLPGLLAALRARGLSAVPLPAFAMPAFAAEGEAAAASPAPAGRASTSAARCPAHSGNG